MTEKKVEWGFDLSGFNSGRELNSFMAKHRYKRAGSHISTVKGRPEKSFKGYSASYRNFFWKCPGFELTTEHSGRKSSSPMDRGADDGFLGYIGAEISPGGMKNWMSFRNEFVKVASVKDESKRRNDFISPPSVLKRQPKISWI